MERAVKRIEVAPRVLQWACERSGVSLDDLEASFPDLPQWMSGMKAPTFRQLEKFAGSTLTPLGALLLKEPPNEDILIPDFRTKKSRAVRRITAPLIETIFQMQRRQDWLREYLEDNQEDPLTFIGSVTTKDRPHHVAMTIRKALGIDPSWASRHAKWEDAFTSLKRSVENLRIMVVVNGIVGNNTRKKLDPEEFRGFVLNDPMAPLIFINGADWKSAQMFTLAHELAHLWLGKGALLGSEDLGASSNVEEQFCNVVAGEFLVPSEELKVKWLEAEASGEPIPNLSRQFKVSQIVIARRAFDTGLISKEQFTNLWAKSEEEERQRREQQKSAETGGGDFYRTQDSRIGMLFGRTVVQAVRGGRILHRDAYNLTGLHGKTFDEFSKRMSSQ